MSAQPNLMENKKVICRGGHEVEPGKTVNSHGWCNLCLKDMKMGKHAGTTAKERDLK